MSWSRTWIVGALSVFALSACTTPATRVYQDEDFRNTGVYSHTFSASAVATCEAARRALLSQGYIVSDVKADIVNGQKSFQPESDSHVEIAFHVVCVSDGPEGTSSTAFVNALQDRYTVKKTPTSASLGVGAVGAVSLPFGSSDDSLVKVASETIPPGPFYDRFFGLTGHYLAEISLDFGPPPNRLLEKSPSPVPAPAVPQNGASGPAKSDSGTPNPQTELAPATAAPPNALASPAAVRGPTANGPTANGPTANGPTANGPTANGPPPNASTDQSAAPASPGSSGAQSTISS